MPDWFSINFGVRQGCEIAPNLFLNLIDCIMETWKEQSIVDLLEQLWVKKYSQIWTLWMTPHCLPSYWRSSSSAWKPWMRKHSCLVWRSTGTIPRSTQMSRQLTVSSDDGRELNGGHQVLHLFGLTNGWWRRLWFWSYKQNPLCPKLFAESTYLVFKHQTPD